MKPKGIIIHHSLTKDGKAVDYDAIKKYHMEVNHWDDIGYHFVIEQQGTKLMTITGRDTSKLGAHCVGKNDHIGICVVGNFDKGKDELSTGKMNALVLLTSSILRMHQLSIYTVHKHSEYAPKSCPGTGFPWDEFMTKLSEAL